MNKAYIALGSPEKFVKLGNFNVTLNSDGMNVYYNLNFGEDRSHIFDVDSHTYKDLEKAHHSFHHSGQGHFKETTTRGTLPLFIGHISDGSVLNNSDMDPLILGVESFSFDNVAAAVTFEENTLFLQPLTGIKQYSILS